LLRIDNELKNAQLERKNQLILTGIIMLFLLVALIVLLYSRYWSKAMDNSKLKELNRELHQVSHEKDRLFSIIAHELRNPLWWFRNITETLSQRFDVMDKQKLNETLFALDESAKNTFLLMDNLLNWSRSKLNLLPFHPVSFDLREVIGQSISQFNSMASQKKITINTDLRHSGRAFGDREQCNIVIRNILSNALKFTQADGTISLLTCDNDGCIHLVVRDTGIGIDPKMIKNLFDESTAYSTLGLMQEKGSGLGLKLCREFAEKNGGSIEVHSALQCGTTIEVTIPRQTPS
jgi:signal transduction histidine kinase